MFPYKFGTVFEDKERLINKTKNYIYYCLIKLF